MMRLQRSHAPWRRLLTALAAAGLSGLVVLAVGGVADAADGPQPVTDYANYPAPIPPGCPQGEYALHELSFSNGRGGEAATLWDLDVAHGDTVTMSWSAFHQGCLGSDGKPAVTVGLAAYDTPKLEFDPTLDEQLVDGWTVCGAGAEPCVQQQDGRYSLSITLPTTDVCNVQLDAFLGLPLAVVGPNGSFYSNVPRGSGTNRLISANHFGVQPCVETTTTVAPTTTEAPTTTTTGGVVETPTTPPTSAEGPSVQPNEGSVPVQQSGPQVQVLDESVTAPSARVLPVTGSRTSDTVRLAAIMTASGMAALGVASALRRRQAA